MATFLRILLLAVITLTAGTSMADEADLVTHEVTITFPQPSVPVHRAWIAGTLPCPDSTVYSQPYTPGSGMDGMTRSDKGYKYLSSQLYQSFSGVSHPVKGVQVFGTFLDRSYNVDDKRLHLAADGTMTKPLRLVVAFYEMDNGYPGKKVSEDTVEVYGKQTSAIVNDHGDASNVKNIYSFTLPLKEEVRMENGYVSVYSVDQSEEYEAAFSMIGDSSQPTGVCYYTQAGSTDVGMAAATFNFCFLGDASEPLARRGLKINRVLSPTSTENGKYAKVQVELLNYGTDDISDASLRLYKGDTLLADEPVGATVYGGSTYKYTFLQRVDCSATGVHTFTIENATPGDEGYADKAVSVNTYVTEGACASSSAYAGKYKYISSVNIGTIHNETENSLYSDFRDQQTDITLGQTLTLTVQRQAVNGDYNKVWVDWNGNGSFDDPGEFVGSLPRGTIDVRIPSNAAVTPGPKTLRIILADKDVSPCGQYTYGETEDYTLNVVQPAGTPQATTDQHEATFTGSGSQTIAVANEGADTLNAAYEVHYELPLSADVAPTWQEPRTVGYAGDYNANMNVDATYVSFAHYYPATTLQAVKGMTITAIDVFVANSSRKSFAAIWKSNGTQYTYAKEPVVKQEFTPKANSWNHIVLDKPFTIDGSDLFIGCALEGCKGVGYLFGIDAGPSKTGFGDLISTEQSGYWWSLADLGSDANVLVRATLGGQPTPAVDWLRIDKDSSAIAAGASDALRLTADATGLTEPHYEAVVRVVSNDPLASKMDIPVYLDLVTNSGIEVVKGAAQSQFRITADRRLVVTGNKAVSLIALYTVDGRQLAMNYATNAIGAGGLKSGLYVVRAVFDDSSEAKATVMVK